MGSHTLIFYKNLRIVNWNLESYTKIVFDETIEALNWKLYKLETSYVQEVIH